LGIKKKRSELLDSTTDDFKFIGEINENQIPLPKKNVNANYKKLSKNNS